MKPHHFHFALALLMLGCSVGQALESNWFFSGIFVLGALSAACFGRYAVFEARLDRHFFNIPARREWE